MSACISALSTKRSEGQKRSCYSQSTPSTLPPGSILQRPHDTDSDRQSGSAKLSHIWDTVPQQIVASLYHTICERARSSTVSSTPSSASVCKHKAAPHAERNEKTTAAAVTPITDLTTNYTEAVLKAGEHQKKQETNAHHEEGE